MQRAEISIRQNKGDYVSGKNDRVTYVREQVNEWVSEWLSDWVSDWVTEWVSEWVSTITLQDNNIL